MGVGRGWGGVIHLVVVVKVERIKRGVLLDAGPGALMFQSNVVKQVVRSMA